MFNYEQPGPYIVKNTDYDDGNPIPVLTAGQTFILGFTDETEGVKYATPEKPVVIFDDFTTSSHYVDFPFKIKSSAMKILSLTNSKDDIRVAFNVLKSIGYEPVSHERHWISEFIDLEVLLPTNPSEQAIIGRCFSSLDNLITLHQRKCQYRGLYGYLSWEQRKLGDVATRHDNLRIPITAKDRIPGDTPYYGANGIQDYVEGYTHEGEFVLVAEDGATDLDNYPVQLISGLSWVNNHAHVIKAIPDVAQNRFIMHLIKSMDIASYLVGGTRSKLNAEVLMGIELKLPSNSEQIYIGALLSDLDSLITLHQRQSNGKAHNIIILSRTKNRQLDIAKSAVLGLETRGNSRKLLNEHPIQQRFLDIL